MAYRYVVTLVPLDSGEGEPLSPDPLSSLSPTPLPDAEELAFECGSPVLDYEGDDPQQWQDVLDTLEDNNYAIVKLSPYRAAG